MSSLTKLLVAPETSEGFGRFHFDYLEQDILPFWLKYARDDTHGGYCTFLNRDGSWYEEDKICTWGQGRLAWTFANLAAEWQPRQEWVDFAQHGINFLDRMPLTDDGRLYYSLTAAGDPLHAPRDWAADLSAVMAWSAWARVSGDGRYQDKARSHFERIWALFQTPGMAHQEFIASTAPIRAHGACMITLNVIQELRKFREEPDDNERIDACIDTLIGLHTDDERECIYEYVGWDGTRLNGAAGRWLNPGHMIEAGIFLIHEGKVRANQRWVDRGVQYIRWGMDWGWDKERGGIFNDVDRDGLPLVYPHPILGYTKLWWQHAEALYGTLLAYNVSADPHFWALHQAVHNFSFKHFADPAYGEWIGLLSPDNTPFNHAKGTERKSAFHLVRNLFHCGLLLD